MEKNYKEKLHHIRTFCFDVDGVFTNNIVFLIPDGEHIRTANVRDGYAVQLAVKKGFSIVIISGGKSEAVKKRFEMLGLEDIFLSVSNKEEVFDRFLSERKIDPQCVCYVGDDIPDYVVMKKAGLACCPADAVPEIKAVAHYISPYKGGEGVVRDILEQAMRIQGLWMDHDGQTW
ncbi:MAG: HAD hydrolase family protein [Crocinitomicaceae bacterium]|nr:HAD hydrolase family protein [Crocinitomicaceae bacterium]